MFAGDPRVNVRLLEFPILHACHDWAERQAEAHGGVTR